MRKLFIAKNKDQDKIESQIKELIKLIEEETRVYTEFIKVMEALNRRIQLQFENLLKEIIELNEEQS